jgi:hypothetical protein
MDKELDEEAGWAEEFEKLRRIEDLNGIEHLRWSLGDVESDKLSEAHNYQSARYIQYRDYPIKCRIVGKTWLDLWKAADKCFAKNLKKYGRWYSMEEFDKPPSFELDDHVYIEGFSKAGNVLVVECGS